MAEPTAAAVLKRPKEHRLEGDRFQLKEYVAREHYARCEMGVTLEVLQDPAYWSHFAPKMSPWDTIIARTDDGTLWAELLVTSVGRNYANVFVLRSHKLTSADVAQTQQAATVATFQYQWKGAKLRHCIIRSDGEIVHSGSQTKVEAVDWAKDNGYDLTAVTLAPATA